MTTTRSPSGKGGSVRVRVGRDDGAGAACVEPPPTLAPPAARSFCTSSSRTSPRFVDTSPPGLLTKSTAPGDERLDRLPRPLQRVRAEHHDGHGRRGEDASRGLGAVQAGHVEVHRHHVGRELRRQRHGFESVLRLPYDLEAIVAGEEARDGIAHERRVVGDEDAQGRHVISP